MSPPSAIDETKDVLMLLEQQKRHPRDPEPERELDDAYEPACPCRSTCSTCTPGA